MAFNIDLKNKHFKEKFMCNIENENDIIFCRVTYCSAADFVYNTTIDNFVFI
jgi:hypothetical protein